MKCFKEHKLVYLSNDMNQNPLYHCNTCSEFYKVINGELVRLVNEEPKKLASGYRKTRKRIV